MNAKKILALSLVLLIVLILTLHQCLFANSNIQNNGYIPNDGFVPNKETAIRIAEAILIPIYGKVIENQKPFIVELKDNSIWIVQGTLKTTKGGVFYIEIQKSDCKILLLKHSK